MRRRIAVVVTGVAALAVVGGGLFLALVAPRGADAQPTSAAAATATIERRTLQATTAVDGTLGYGGTYSIANLVAPSGGIEGLSVVTQIAVPGSIVEPGGVLYTLNGNQLVMLMSGQMPAWRDMGPGISDGPDVLELEADLKALGVATSSMTVDEHWDSHTTAAVKAWQGSLGLDETGSIALGQVVFEPAALRITSDTASLGSTLQRGSPVLSASSTDRVVSVALDPAMQTQVKVGDKVSILLPGNSTTPGTVSNVGSVATLPAGNGAGAAGNSPTIQVSVSLDDPGATGTIDQAPVSVNITTATATNVLAVPVTALVALLEGGYAVQLDQAGQLSYVPVTLGLFADGWVQISGPDLSAGQSVVVAQ